MTTLKMTTAIFVDSRLRTSGTDSDFEFGLRESIHLSNARLRVDKVTFKDSFLTTDAGSNLYFRDSGEGIDHWQIYILQLLHEFHHSQPRRIRSTVAERRGAGKPRWRRLPGGGQSI